MDLYPNKSKIPAKSKYACRKNKKKSQDKIRNSSKGVDASMASPGKEYFKPSQANGSQPAIVLLLTGSGKALVSLVVKEGFPIYSRPRKLKSPNHQSKPRTLCCILPRDVWTEQLFANSWVFRIKPLEVIHFEQRSRKQPRFSTKARLAQGKQ